MTQEIVKLANTNWLLESVMAEVLAPPDDVTSDRFLPTPAADRRPDHDNPEARLEAMSDGGSERNLFRDMDEAILELEDANSEGARRVGMALRRWRVEGASTPLDKVLGLRTQPGQRAAKTIDMLARRDDLVRRIAQTFFPDIAPAEQARRLHSRWSRYASASAGWRSERADGVVPVHRVGTIEGELWKVMKVRDYLLSERTVRLVLAAS